MKKMKINLSSIDSSFNFKFRNKNMNFIFINKCAIIRADEWNIPKFYIRKW